MESMKINSGTTPTKLVPHAISWDIVKGMGQFRVFSPEEKSVRALRLAFKRYLDVKDRTPAENNQYYLEGKNIWLDSVDSTQSPNGSTYRARGRAEVGQINIPADSLSTAVVTFDITFKDTVNEWKLADIELVSGSIDVLPADSKLVP